MSDSGKVHQKRRRKSTSSGFSSLVEARHHRLERHTADRAAARTVADDLGVHRAGVFGAARSRRAGHCGRSMPMPALAAVAALMGLGRRRAARAPALGIRCVQEVSSRMSAFRIAVWTRVQRQAILGCGRDFSDWDTMWDIDFALPCGHRPTLGNLRREPRSDVPRLVVRMKPRLALHLGWRLLLAVSLAASPWSAALSSATAAAHEAAQHDMPCHDADAGKTSPADTGCEDDCCPAANCVPAFCVSHTTGAIIAAVPDITSAPAADGGNAWHAPHLLHPPPGEALRPPIR